MVKFYVTQILLDKIELADVPERWRSQVEHALKQWIIAAGKVN